jgi:hypothetical protein
MIFGKGMAMIADCGLPALRRPGEGGRIAFSAKAMEDLAVADWKESANWGEIDPLLQCGEHKND